MNFEMFNNFDYQTLAFIHDISINLKWLFSPIADLFAIIGSKGLIFILISVVCLKNAKTRKLSAYIMIGLALDFFIADLFLKNYFHRLRPYNNLDVKEFLTWANFVNATIKSSFSFPSGHLTVTLSSLVCICYYLKNKKSIFLSIIFVIIMAFSRMYFMAHYPTDCMFGIIVGLICGTMSIIITNLIWKRLDKISYNGIIYKFLNEDLF